MESIIGVLEKEHRVIRQALARLSGVHEGCPSGAGELERLERLLLSHISREDTDVYLPLKKIVRLAPEAARFLERSRRGLEDLKISALIFFEKYKGERENRMCAGFGRDLARLADRLDERIRFEDRELFPFLTNLWSRL